MRGATAVASVEPAGVVQPAKSKARYEYRTEPHHIMSAIILGILIIAAGLPALLVMVFVVEVLAAVLERPADKALPSPGIPRGTVAVLIPAHNEGTALQPTIEDLKAQLASGDRLLVVADNCIDETAAVARVAGAEVLERHDAGRRGKGYALDFGLKHLSSSPPDLVIIIDADCRVAAGAIEQLARACVRTQRPIQALDLMIAPVGSAADYRVATFAWRVKNWVRPLGLQALGLPCQLMGTGMAFPWTAIRKAELASGHIVEDLKLGLELARAGHAPLFCPLAIITSEFPSTAVGAESQRQRWEGGHLSMVASVAIPLIFTATVHRNRDLLVLALDMAVPPLTFLAFSSAGAFVLAGLALIAGLSLIPLVISATSLAALFITILLCWLKFGRDLLPIEALGRLGPFFLSKIRLYREILGGRTHSQWTRADRRASETEGDK
jgi:cellulose synthase/poly-beta-1,6-N-acetylglucosamine synthase-like glycosyltransferase